MADFVAVGVILLAPLIAAALLGGFNMAATARGRLVSVAGPVVSLFAALFVVVRITMHPPETARVVTGAFDWIAIGDLSVRVGLVYDSLSAVFIIIVTFLFSILGWFAASRAVHGRRLAWLQVALFASCFALLAPGPVTFFAGWMFGALCIGLIVPRGIGSTAGGTLFVMQRIADMGLLVGSAVLMASMAPGGIGFADLINRIDTVTPGGALVAAVLIAGAALIRAGIIPAHVWMTAMMEHAPASASAAAISAGIAPVGVYVFARFSFLFGIMPGVGTNFAWFAAAIAMTAALSCGFQSDVRRVIVAVSVAHLGLVFVGLGLGAYPTAIYLAVVHALGITLLVLAAGTLISDTGTADMWLMGGLRKRLNATHMAMLTGTLTAAGMPPLAGFFALSGVGYAAYVNGFTGMWSLVMFTVALLAYGLFRMLFLIFYGTPRDAEIFDTTVERSIPGAVGPLSLLAVMAVFASFMNIPETLGGAAIFISWLTPNLVVPDLFDLGRRTALLLMLAAAGATFAGTLVAYQAFWRDAKPAGERRVTVVLKSAFGLDAFARFIVEQVVLRLSRWLIVVGEVLFSRGVWDGIVRGVMFAARLASATQNGMARAYALYMAVGIAAAAMYVYWMLG